MDNFPEELSKPLMLIIFTFLIGVVKAFLRKSPLSKKDELIKYHQYLKKPVILGFAMMFFLVFILGFLGGGIISTSFIILK